MNSKGNPDARAPHDGQGGKREFTLRPGGGYRRLRSFQTATIIYDATVSFCERFIDKRSRLVYQMVQAARSGRQWTKDDPEAPAVRELGREHKTDRADQIDHRRKP